MANELTIVSAENVSAIASNAPKALQDNKTSHDRCIEFGQKLLDRVRKEGMSDALDKDIALFIDRAKKTVRKMNDVRSPITKLFDDVRTVFTSMENDVNVSKHGSVPFLLQEERNKYATKKAAEEAARRAEEERRKLAEQAKTKYRTDLIEDYKRQLSVHINNVLNSLTSLNSSLDLQNWDAVTAQIKEVNVSLDPEWINGVIPSVFVSPNLLREDASSIRSSVILELAPKFKEQFNWEVSEHRDSIIMRLPSKKKELQAAAQVSAEEAEIIKAEIKAREEAEAARQAEARRQQEEAEARQREISGQMAEIGGLFEHAAAAMPTYQPKTSVKKKVNPLNPEAFPVIFAYWWDGEGKFKSVEDLSKMFKTMLTYCNSKANDKSKPEFIRNEHVEYVDEIKAK